MTKTKKNLRPQQVAPVQREITATTSLGGTAAAGMNVEALWGDDWLLFTTPFAGDDAE